MSSHHNLQIPVKNQGKLFTVFARYYYFLFTHGVTGCIKRKTEVKMIKHGELAEKVYIQTSQLGKDGCSRGKLSNLDSQ